MSTDGFHNVEFAIALRLAPSTRRGQQRTHAAPLILRADRGREGQRTLGVTLAIGAGCRVHTKYHRLVALTLLSCHWGVGGALLKHPVKVSPHRFGDFEVHHVDGDPRNCALANLAVLPSKLHQHLHRAGLKLPRPACGWGV